MLPPLGIYIVGEAREVTYTLNCSGEFNRARFGDSEVFEKISSGPIGQNRSYYCFCKAQASQKKMTIFCLFVLVRTTTKSIQFINKPFVFVFIFSILLFCFYYQTATTKKSSFYIRFQYTMVEPCAFGRRFLVDLPPRSSWLSQKTSEILISDSVIYYTDGSLCEGREGAGVFSDTLDIRQSDALGSLATVFETEEYAILRLF
jgi:hypothetical protein